ncbi:hypothetical protein Tco_0492833 [Tanacetum coccineum]
MTPVTVNASFYVTSTADALPDVPVPKTPITTNAFPVWPLPIQHATRTARLCNTTTTLAVTRSLMKKCLQCVLAGPNLEHSDVEITDPSSQPQLEHMDEGFIATAYPEVQENLKLTVDEQMIPEEPVSSTGTLLWRSIH